jgi:UDP-4-amino-4-deoxy-L-arabinose-oxoglutarate aminotransferase
MIIEFYKHNIGDEEKTSVEQTLNSVFLTTGPKTKEFEEKFSAKLNIDYCIGVSSWTMGNLITLKALGIGTGDEVITSPLTFIATANTIIQAGATPIFVDVEKETGNIDASKIESAITTKTKAIIPIHLYGQMCDMKKIYKIAKKYNLKIIEDAAHCIEGIRDGIKPGQLSTAAIFSFYATKNITCGEGGAIITNDKKLYERLIKFRSHGMSKSAADRYTKVYQHWDMELLGYKCNMNDIQAALLIPQISKMDDNRKKREDICAKYEDGFSKNRYISYPKKLDDTIHARHLFTIWVDQLKRDKIMHQLQKANIGVAVNFRSIHLLSYYKNKYGYMANSFPNAEFIGNSTISIPLYTKLKKNEIKYVIEKVNSIVS